MTYTIHPVTSKRHASDFLDVPRILYRDDPNWICPLDGQLNGIFDPSKNTYFSHGSAQRWVLRNNAGQLCGRIAAFVDDEKKQNAEVAAGGIGFFECCDDQGAANLLFDTAAGWLKNKHVEAMDGPINFGENDRFWGLLVEGFTTTSFTTNYHHPYYRQLFENYGFRAYYEMTTNTVDLSRPMDERFERIAGWLRAKEGITFRHPTLDSLEEYAHHFRTIYNDAWQFHEEYKPLTEDRALKFAREMKFLFISKMMPFAFVREEPAGFLICTPDLNQVFKSKNGKLNLVDKFLFSRRSRNDFSWYRDRGILTRGHALAIGIRPRFQQYGLETGMMMSSIDEVRKMGFKTIELRWAGDFNPKIVRLHAAVGATQAHKHITYRFLFDPAREFRRYREIPMNTKEQMAQK
ncbi:MAG: GNAT family N-acetyltransferase [Taibaiella sp.]|nr:GNAT family N-acetyltransferase [Taibaiella sp.]